jgi:predicted Zn-dependent protease
MRNTSHVVLVAFACLIVGMLLGGLGVAFYGRSARARLIWFAPASLRSLTNDYLVAVTEGNLEFQKGNVSEAITCYQKAAILEPVNPLPLISIADVYDCNNEPSNAVVWLRRARDVAADSGNIEYIPIIDQKLRYFEQDTNR